MIQSVATFKMHVLRFRQRGAGKLFYLLSDYWETFQSPS